MKESYRLTPLSDEQKHWAIDARAAGMSFEEIADHFREVYPDYGSDIPSDVFPHLFTHRLKRMLNTSSASAKQYLETKKLGDTPINIEALPLVVPHVRLLAYQRLWDETPARTLQRVVDTAEGEVRVYKENTRERLAILTEFRKELEILGIVENRSGKKVSNLADSEDVVEVIESGDLWGTEDVD